MSQRTFSIVKPDAVKKGLAGAILSHTEKAGFRIVAIKKMSLSTKQARRLLLRSCSAAVLYLASGVHVFGADLRDGA